MGILYIKALHIIFVISWFAGLLYIVRLFIYHTEAQAQSEEVRLAVQSQLKVMSKRLWSIITWPAAILATLFGLWMIVEWELNGREILQEGWLQVKLVLILLLWIYQLLTHRIYRQLQRDKVVWTSNQLRLWNELATLWMVTIVFTAILKGGLNWIYGTIGFFGIGVLLMIGIKIYRRYR